MAPFFRWFCRVSVIGIARPFWLSMANKVIDRECRLCNVADKGENPQNPLLFPAPDCQSDNQNCPRMVSYTR